MFTEETLKTLKKGDAVYVGPRRTRNGLKEPRGEMIVVRKGLKWVYLATQEHIDWWKTRDYVNQYDERVAIKDYRGTPPGCDGYESPLVFESEADYQAWLDRSAVRRDCHEMLRDTFRQGRALECASVEQLEKLRAILTEIMGMGD